MLVRSCVPLLVALSVVVASPAIAGDLAPKTVAAGKLGSLAELQALRFRGHQTLDEAALRRAVDCDLAVAAACDPYALRGPYLAAVEARVATEHRHVGYHDVAVKASVNEQDRRIDVAVEPGRRYRFGRVVITGNKAVSTAELERWLTQPTPDDSDGVSPDADVGPNEPTQWIRSDRHEADFIPALWRPGEFASFTTATIPDATRLVQNVYVEFGRWELKLEVKLKFHDDTVDLAVDVSDEGPAAKIESIAVAGNQRSSTREILKLIDVEVGQPFDRKLRSRIERDLWHSGRFRNFSVDFQPATAPDANFASTAAGKSDDSKAKSDSSSKTDTQKSDDTKNDASKAVPKLIDVVPRQPSRLTVTVLESPAAPPLGTELSPEQQALLKFRGWMLNSSARGDEFEFRIADGDAWSLEVIVDPRRGWLVDWSYASKRLGGIRRSYGLRSTTEGFGLYAFDQGKKIEFAADGSQWNFLTNYYLGDDPDELINFHYDFGSRRPVAGRKAAPLVVKHRISPATIVAFASTADGVKPQFHCTISDGVLQIDGENARIKVDAATGKFLGMSYLGVDRNELELGPGARLECRVVPGALAAREKAWVEKTKSLRNEVDEANRISSLLKFVFDDPCWDEMPAKKEKLTQWLQIFRRAAEADLADVYLDLERLYEPVAGRYGDVDQANFPLRFADACFPRGSWAWLQTRLFALESSGKPSFAQQALSQAADAGTWGPLAYRSAALIGAKYDYRYLTQTWAARAAAPSDAATRARDWQPLLAESHFSGRAVRAMAKFVRSLDDAEAELVYEVFFADAPKCVVCLEALRAEPKRPLDEVLTKVLDKIWTPSADPGLAKLAQRLLTNR